MALIKMIPVGSGSGGNNYISMLYGFTIYGGRCTFKSGGFRVKNGVCYVDAVLTATSALEVDKTVFNSGTVPLPSSAQGSSWTDLGDIKVRYNSSGVTYEFYTNKAISSGADIHFVGQYLTDALDTDA